MILKYTTIGVKFRSLFYEIESLPIHGGKLAIHVHNCAAVAV